MAPPCRRFYEGDLVFAKLRGYPHWPARVIGRKSGSVSGKNVSYQVVFYGTNETASVFSRFLWNFDSAKPKLGKSRKNNKQFNKAMKEIQAEIDNQGENEESTSEEPPAKKFCTDRRVCGMDQATWKSILRPCYVVMHRIDPSQYKADTSQRDSGSATQSAPQCTRTSQPAPSTSQSAPQHSFQSSPIATQSAPLGSPKRFRLSTQSERKSSHQLATQSTPQSSPKRLETQFLCGSPTQSTPQLFPPQVSRQHSPQPSSLITFPTTQCSPQHATQPTPQPQYSPQHATTSQLPLQFKYLPSLSVTVLTPEKVMKKIRTVTRPTKPRPNILKQCTVRINDKVIDDYVKKTSPVKKEEILEKPEGCKLCKETFTSFSILKDHVSLVHKETLCRRCRKCGSYFDSEEILATHLKNCIEVVQSLRNKKRIKYQCVNCLKLFLNKQLLTEHISTMHASNTVQEDDIKIKGSIYKILSEHSNCVIHCNTCKKDYKTKEFFWSHIVNKLLTCLCPFCGIDPKIYEKISFLRHLQDHCLKLESCVCEVCHVILLNKYSSMTHTVNTHYQKNHQLKQEKEEPDVDAGQFIREVYDCDEEEMELDVSFQQSVEMEIEIPREKIYMVHCSTCSEDISDEKYLKEHAKNCCQNALIACSLCEVKIERQIYQEHIESHFKTNKEAIRCRKCELCFINSFNQTMHLVNKHYSIPQ